MTTREYLLSVEAERGRLTPAMVFELAKPETSPIHAFFEWDKERGWEAHNLARAAALIRQVKVVIRTPDDAGIRTRQFLLTRGSADEPQSHYMSIERALGTPEIRDEVLATARRDLQIFERRYAALLKADELLASGMATMLEALNVA